MGNEGVPTYHPQDRFASTSCIAELVGLRSMADTMTYPWNVKEFLNMAGSQLRYIPSNIFRASAHDIVGLSRAIMSNGNERLSTLKRLTQSFRRLRPWTHPGIQDRHRPALLALGDVYMT